MSHFHDEFQQWPFLNQEEFELACAFFDQRYVRASLGPTRQIFKIRSRRTLTAGTSYIEILRILQLPEDEDELSLALAGLGKIGGNIDLGNSTDVEMIEEDGDEVSNVLCRLQKSALQDFTRREMINWTYRKHFARAIQLLG